METVIAKLHKLIAHERSARSLGSVEEAESFAAKIQAMLFQHKLGMSEIEFAAQEINEPVVVEPVYEEDLTGVGRTSRRKKTWLTLLIEAVTRANFCRAEHYIATNDVIILGRKSDRLAAVAMIRYLHDACLECADINTKAYEVESVFDSKRKYRNGFKLGFAHAIGQRLTVEKDKLVAALGEQGLIRLDRVEKAIDDEFRKRDTTERRPLPIDPGSYKGFVAGKEYGWKIGINAKSRLKA
jgi:hypothetical protein